MLKEFDNLSEMQKFTLKLKARTENKRLIEALEILKAEYPFEIDIEKLILRQTDNKGFYDVYISKVKVKKESKLKKYLQYLVISIILIFSILTICVIKSKNNRKKIYEQKQLELQKLENEKITKEKELKLAELEYEYKNNIKESFCKVYSCIECIYSVMTKGSVIENIFIDNRDFSVEVTTKDALVILKAFEESSLFNNVKMNRTTIKDSNEYVTYTGTFPVIYKNPDSSFTQDEKITYYEKQIEKNKNRLKKQKIKQLSEYIAEIRKCLHVNGCNEQYIQLHSVDKMTEVEFFILSSSSGILNFLDSIQKDEENLFDIKQVKIRNNEDRNRIQTTICFKSWIDLQDNIVSSEEYMANSIAVTEIDKMFYKKPSITKNVKTYSQSLSQKKSNATAVRMKNLSYVGMSKLNGETLIVVKDDSMGSIYKLVLSDSEKNGNCCFVSENKYIAKIRNEYYEVKK